MEVGKSVWFAKRISGENAETAEYDKPIKIDTRFHYLTIQPAVAKGDLAIFEFGEKLSDTWNGVAMARHFKDFFHKGDVMWVDGESPWSEQNAPIENRSPEEGGGYGSTANAVIKNAVPVNLTISLTLERNQNQVKQ